MLDITLTDLIHPEVLQKIQAGFSNYTGIAALTTDTDGNPVTHGTHFTTLCMDLIRKTKNGCFRCMECDKEGALISLKNEGPSVYFCHAGLMDFAAPILVEGEVIGSFIGGQVLTAPLNEETARATARELGIAETVFLEAAAQVPIIPFEQVQRAAQFLFDIASILSEMAYSSYKALSQSRQLEQNTRSHNHYIIDMNISMKSHVQDWIQAAGELQNPLSPKERSAILSRLMSKGTDFISAIDETVEFAQMATGEILLKESEYNLHDLISQIVSDLRPIAEKKEISLVLSESGDFPSRLLGDTLRIRKLITKLIQNSIHDAKEGSIYVMLSTLKHSYATRVLLALNNPTLVFSPEALAHIKTYMESPSALDSEDIFGLSVIAPFLKKMSGTLEVQSNPEEGTTFFLQIPQLALPEKTTDSF
jgi:ligand-binding sensor protein